MMTEKKLTFGKIQVVVTTIIFISVLLASFTMDFSKVTDTAFAATAISVTGTIYAAVLVNYYKKARSENLIKLRILAVKEISKTQVKTYEDIAKIKRKYDISSEDLDEIKEEVYVDDFLKESIEGVDTKLNELTDEAESVTDISDIQSVG